MEEVDSLRLDFKKAIDLKSGTLVYPAKSRFVVKETSMAEWEIMALSSIMDHIALNGFRNMVTLRKDISGKPYFKDGSRIYLIYDYFEGSKLKLNSEEEGIRFSKFIAEFHTCSEEYVQPSGLKTCVLWGKKTEEFRGLTLRLEKNYCSLKLRGACNEFEAYILEYGEDILKRSRASMKILKSAGYLKALENSMRKKEICLNKISNNSAVVYNDRVMLKKVFDMAYNMVEEDIALVLKKVIEETRNLNICDNIIESYRSIRGLEENSSAIIKAESSFPEDTVKIIDKYFKSTEADEILPAKLKKYWGRESKVNLLEV